MQAISLIYGDQILDDLEFCCRHEEVLARYSHGIMTLRPSPRKALEATAADPTTVPGWRDSLEDNPPDHAVLREFSARLIRYYDLAGRWAGE